VIYVVMDFVSSKKGSKKATHGCVMGLVAFKGVTFIGAYDKQRI
jgi:hypothetical protein